MAASTATARRPSAAVAKRDPIGQRYRVAVGHTHGVRPGGIVGAITAEGGLNGKDLGRIDIYDTFSTVEIAGHSPPPPSAGSPRPRSAASRCASSSTPVTTTAAVPARRVRPVRTARAAPVRAAATIVVATTAVRARERGSYAR